MRWRANTAEYCVTFSPGTSSSWNTCWMVVLSRSASRNVSSWSVALWIAAPVYAMLPNGNSAAVMRRITIGSSWKSSPSCRRSAVCVRMPVVEHGCDVVLIALGSSSRWRMDRPMLRTHIRRMGCAILELLQLNNVIKVSYFTYLTLRLVLL